MAQALGIRVNVCGDIDDGLERHQRPPVDVDRGVPGDARGAESRA
jgi:hypothetical protein